MILGQCNHRVDRCPGSQSQRAGPGMVWAIRSEADGNKLLLLGAEYRQRRTMRVCKGPEEQRHFLLQPDETQKDKHPFLISSYLLSCVMNVVPAS